MIPIPQIDIARACRSGGLMSSITDCDSGPMKAALIPWMNRKRTISSRFCAEIGRASCGERVCRYVELPVVAVSLKTTHNEDTTPNTLNAKELACKIRMKD